jgi:hypothetical protein
MMHEIMILFNVNTLITDVSAEPPASVFMVSLKMKAAGSSESLASLYQIARSDVGQTVSLSVVRSSKLTCLNLFSVLFCSGYQSSSLEIVAYAFIYTFNIFVSAHYTFFFLSKETT